MHNLWLLSFFSMNNTGAPQDEELGWINPFCNCSPSCFLSSFSSSTDILYGLLAIGPDPGTKSIRNSTSLSGGIPGSSSGNTSGYSLTIGTPLWHPAKPLLENRVEFVHCIVVIMHCCQNYFRK